MNLYELFSSDKESEEEGRWVDLTPTLRVKIRSFQAKIVSDTRDRLMKPYQNLVRAAGKLPDEQNEAIGNEVIATAVIADWEGVKDEAGNDLEYNKANALKILVELPKFGNWIVSHSMDAQNYKDEVLEDGAKN
jgi:hypothetical protein